jgi:WD40 repeat protein/serine/threonine protein kinase
MATIDSPRDLLAEAIDEFTAEVRRGNDPAIADYVVRYQGVAADIQRFFPAILMMERCRRDIAPSMVTSPSVSRHLGDYEIIREVGRGGMGVVYEARQVSLDRRVALKMLPTAACARPELLERFRNEALAAARLHHTNIVQVHGVGESEGHHFYVMQFIEGQSLAALRARSDPGCDAQWSRFVAQIGLEAGEALAYAHSQGVLHRDIKPSNLLVDSHETVWITDFGLAKIEGAGDLTATGDVPGTVRYLAPERLQGRSDPRSDVYSLGLVLYELLLGRPAFDASDPSSLLRQVAESSPPAPRRINPAVPRDLETIVLTCLDHEPARRYQSAQELAADCRRYIEDRPIAARRTSPVELLWRWSRRNKTVAASLATAALLLIVLAVGSLLTAAHFRRQEHVQRQLTAKNKDLADETRKQADQLRRNLYFAEMNLAAQAAESEGGLGLVRQILDSWQGKQPDLRGWEWHYLKGLCSAELVTIQAHDRGVNTLAFSPDGLHIVSGGEEGDVKIWNAASGTEVATLPQHGRTEPASDARLVGVISVAWSPDGKRLASAPADAPIHVWDTDSNALVATLRGHEGGTLAVAWHPASRRLASSGQDATVVVWDTVDGSEKLVLRGHTGGVTAIVWSPDGTRLATASRDERVKVWDTATGNEVLSISELDGAARRLAWSSDGRRLAAGAYNGSVSILDPADGRKVTVLRGHSGGNSSVAWEPHGDRLLSGGSYARTIKLWNAKTGKTIRTLDGHTGDLNAALWSPDGTRIASGSSDGTIKIWDATTSRDVAPFRPHDAEISTLQWSPDGKRIASISGNGNVKVWNADTRKIQFTAGLDLPAEWLLAWSPDGTGLATAGAHQTIQIWDAASGAILKELPRQGEGVVRALAWSRDGKHLAEGGAGKSITVWDLTTGQILATLPGHRSGVDAVAFSPDGKQLASAGWDHTVRLWDVDERRHVRTLTGHRGFLRAVAWSPTGSHLASGGDGGTIRIWRVADGKEVSALHGHTGSAWALAWSPDGQRLASGGFDGTVKIWDPIAGEQVMSVRKHSGPVHSVDWSRDSTRLASGGLDRTVVLYDSRPNCSPAAE